LTRLRPLFPPDVAAALQRPAGRVSVRYTTPERLAPRRQMDMVLMETPYETVLAALVLDTKDSLRFIRTGNAAEGVRVARTDAGHLIGAARHWDIELAWDADSIEVTARAQDGTLAP
jgi:hypothetical protein